MSDPLDDEDIGLIRFREELRRYADRGWKLVRLHGGAKMAFEKDWPRLERAPEDFHRGQNVGVRFGPESGGLCESTSITTRRGHSSDGPPSASTI